MYEWGQWYAEAIDGAVEGLSLEVEAASSESHGRNGHVTIADREYASIRQ